MFKHLILPLAAAATLLAAGPALAAGHTITVTARDMPYAATYTPDGVLLGTSVAPRIRPVAAHGDLDGDGRDETVTAADGIIAIHDGDQLVGRLSPFGDRAIIAISVADVDGDGHADIIAAHGAGAPLVKVYSGADGTLVKAFYPPGPTDQAIIAIAGAPGSGSAGTHAIIAVLSAGSVRVLDATTLALRAAFSPFGGAPLGGLAIA